MPCTSRVLVRKTNIAKKPWIMSKLPPELHGLWHLSGNSLPPKKNWHLISLPAIHRFFFLRIRSKALMVWNHWPWNWMKIASCDLTRVGGFVCGRKEVAYVMLGDMRIFCSTGAYKSRETWLKSCDDQIIHAKGHRGKSRDWRHFDITWIHISFTDILYILVYIRSLMMFNVSTYDAHMHIFICPWFFHHVNHKQTKFTISYVDMLFLIPPWFSVCHISLVQIFTAWLSGAMCRSSSPTAWRP